MSTSAKTDKEFMTHGDCPVCPAKHGEWCLTRVPRTFTERILRRPQRWESSGNAIAHRGRIERTLAEEFSTIHASDS